MKKDGLLKIIFGKVTLAISLLTVFMITTGFTTIAHRGETYNGTQGIVEHTFQAYDKAISDGADYIEMDLYQTIDGVLVDSHDPNVKRLTGQDLQIAQSTWAQLSGLKVSSGETLHSLEQVFARYQNNLNVKFMIETRTQNNELVMESDLVNLVNKYNLANRVYYESFSLDSLKKLKQLQPNVATMMLTNQNKKLETTNLLQDSKVDSFGAKFYSVTKSEIQQIHQAGKKIYPWFNFNSEKGNEVAVVKESGVDGIFTTWVANYTTKSNPIREVAKTGSSNIGIIKINTHNQGEVKLKNSQNKYLNKYLPNGSRWKVFSIQTIGNESFLNVGGNQYIPTKFSTWGERVVRISYKKSGVNLLNGQGKYLGRYLKYNSGWKNLGAEMINGQAMAKIGGNQFVPFKYL